MIESVFPSGSTVKIKFRPELSVYILVLCQTHKLTQYGEHGLVAVPYSPSELRVRHRELSCTQGDITNITHSLRYLNTELHT